MEFIDIDKRHILRPRGNVRLIQNCQFKKDALDKKVLNKFEDLLSLGFMGSFEYQTGLQYYSLRRMVLNSDFYKVFELSKYKNFEGKSLKVYAPEEFISLIKMIIDKLITTGKYYDNICTIKCHIGNVNGKLVDKTDLWWDFDNDYFIFFDHEEKVIELMNSLTNNKFGYNEGKTTKAININFDDYSHYITKNLTIKDYCFDSINEKHYVQFKTGVKLESIFRDALVMARVDGGKVEFEVNGMHYEINENTRLDDIIFDYVIDIEDECFESTSIKLLKKRENNNDSLLKVLKKAYIIKGEE